MIDRAFYNYAIEGIEVNENNPEVLNIHYGAGKTPLYIFKKDVQSFTGAIICPEEMREREFKRLPSGDEIEVLNYLLKGRAMILCTDFENYLEYCNGAQIGVKEIAGLRINGQIDLINAFDYENLEPSFEVLYPIK